MGTAIGKSEVIFLLFPIAVKRPRELILPAQNKRLQLCNLTIATAVPRLTCLVAVAATAPAAAAIHLAVAIGAIDRLVTAWYEGYFGVFAAVGAYNLGHCALGATVATAAAVAAAISAATAVAAVATLIACGLLGCTAIGATSWLAVALLVVEILLALCKGEACPAIAAR